MLRRFVPIFVLTLAACAKPDATLCVDPDANPGDAIAACTRLLAASDKDDAHRARWYEHRAHHARNSGAFNEAIEDYNRAIELKPKDAAIRVWRGLAYGVVGQRDRALQDFDQAALLDPTMVEAHVNRAAALSEANRFAESEEAFDRVVALTDRIWQAYDGRCWVRAVIGEDLEGALSDCNRALAKQPGAGNPLNNRGLVHYRMQRYAESVADYTASISAEPEIASSYYMRGLARRALGDFAAADADIAEGLRREPGVAGRYAGYGIREVAQPQQETAK